VLPLQMAGVDGVQQLVEVKLSVVHAKPLAPLLGSPEPCCRFLAACRVDYRFFPSRICSLRNARFRRINCYRCISDYRAGRGLLSLASLLTFTCSAAPAAIFTAIRRASSLVSIGPAARTRLKAALGRKERYCSCLFFEKSSNRSPKCSMMLVSCQNTVG